MSEFTVFLSHSSKDKDLVRRIDRQLKSAGFGTWHDENDIPFGKSIPAEIQKGLDSSDILLIFLSEYAVASKWVENEWQAKFFTSVAEEKISVVPVLLADCQIPAFLRDKKYVDFRSVGEFDASFAALLSFLSTQRSESNQIATLNLRPEESILNNVVEILEDLESESISLPFHRDLKIVTTLKDVPRSGKRVRLDGFEPYIKPRSIYDHLLSLAHLADCVLPFTGVTLTSSDRRDLALCIAYHELNEVILGDIPSYTSLTQGTREMIRVYSEERLRSVSPDQRESIANNLIWMFLSDKHRQALSATMDIFAKPDEGIFPLFRALDKMDPIVSVWRYLHEYRGQLGDNPREFNKKMKDFFENPDVKSYMADKELDTRLIETVVFLQDRANAWDYYVERETLFSSSIFTSIPPEAIAQSIEGISLYSD